MGGEDIGGGGVGMSVGCTSVIDMDVGGLGGCG